MRPSSRSKLMSSKFARASRALSFGGCFPTRRTRPTALWIFKRVRVALRRKTGRRCCCVSTSNTASAKGSKRSYSRRAKAISRASRAPRSKWRVNTHSATCAPKPVSIVWSARAHLIRPEGVTLHSRRSTYTLKSTIRLKSISILLMSASIRSEPPVPAGSTSTRLTQQFG